jgi:hypothetical protein
MWEPKAESTITLPSSQQKEQYLRRVMYDRQQTADAAIRQAEAEQARDFRYGR